jgi:hypothetical protein
MLAYTFETKTTSKSFRCSKERTNVINKSITRVGGAILGLIRIGFFLPFLWKILPLVSSQFQFRKIKNVSHIALYPF